MADTHHAQGPGKSVLGIGQRIVSIMVEMVETRLRLAVVELEEEKANLFQLLLMLGLTMLFAAFGLMSLMVLIIWAVDPQYRLNAMIATTVPSRAPSTRPPMAARMVSESFSSSVGQSWWSATTTVHGSGRTMTLKPWTLT